jgi:hypothetical protein
VKRLLPIVAVIALSLPATAGAKGLVLLSVCGTNGCHTTRDKHELANAMDAIPQADPGQTGAFFKLREAIGEPGQPKLIGRTVSQWMPTVGVIRGTDGPTAGYTLPTPQTERVLLRLARGLHPFPASKLPGAVPNARVDEVVPAPAPDEGGGGFNWAWSLLAIPPLALLLWRRRLA